jgi:hypothetical protein
MLFFDYKIIILFGLVVIIYFIYKEIELLRNRIDKLENNKLITYHPKKYLKQNNELQITQDEKIISESLNNTTTSDTSKSMILAESSVNLTYLNNNDMHEIIDKKVIIEPETINVNHLYQDVLYISQMMNMPNITAVFDNIDSDDDHIESSASKHLAIYSNDNEQVNESQCSLIESIKNSTCSPKVNLSPKTKKITEIELHEQNQTFIELSKPQVDLYISSDFPKEQNKSNNESEVENIFKASHLDEKMDITKLNNMKLVEIKKIAENNKILLTKKIEGVYKPKNKSELINDILEKNK